MSKSKEDYMAEGRAAFNAGAAVPGGAGWQVKARQEGWDAAQAEYVADDVAETTVAQVLPATKIIVHDKVQRDAERRTQAYMKRYAWRERLRKCALETANMNRRGRRQSNAPISHSIRRADKG